MHISYHLKTLLKLMIWPKISFVSRPVQHPGFWTENKVDVCINDGIGVASSSTHNYDLVTSRL